MSHGTCVTTYSVCDIEESFSKMFEDEVHFKGFFGTILIDLKQTENHTTVSNKVATCQGK